MYSIGNLVTEQTGFFFSLSVDRSLVFIVQKKKKILVLVTMEYFSTNRPTTPSVTENRHEHTHMK